MYHVSYIMYHAISLMYEQRDAANDAREASFWRDIMYVAVGK